MRHLLRKSDRLVNLAVVIDAREKHQDLIYPKRSLHNIYWKALYTTAPIVWRRKR
jgi:hypothetical protein